MKPPAFQFYAADFLVGTADMEAAEVGAYIRLLCHQWDRGFVPKDKAARLAGTKLSSAVLAKFIETNGELRNARLEAVRQKQSEYHEQQSRRGKAGAEARWDGVRHATANHEPMAPPSSRERRTDSSPSSSSSPSSDDPDPEAGAFSKQEGRQTGMARQEVSVFQKDHLSLAHLSDDALLYRWFEFAVSRPNPIVSDSEANLLRVFGAAVHALRAKTVGGKPVRSRVGLFAAIVQKGETAGGWSIITQSEEDEAHRRLKRLRQQGPSDA